VGSKFEVILRYCVNSFTTWSAKPAWILSFGLEYSDISASGFLSMKTANSSGKF
jgi:hypothetical protein